MEPPVGWRRYLAWARARCGGSGTTSRDPANARRHAGPSICGHAHAWGAAQERGAGRRPEWRHASSVRRIHRGHSLLDTTVHGRIRPCVHWFAGNAPRSVPARSAASSTCPAGAASRFSRHSPATRLPLFGGPSPTGRLLVSPAPRARCTGPMVVLALRLKYPSPTGPSASEAPWLPLYTPQASVPRCPTCPAAPRAPPPRVPGVPRRARCARRRRAVAPAGIRCLCAGRNQKPPEPASAPTVPALGGPHDRPWKGRMVGPARTVHRAARAAGCPRSPCSGLPLGGCAVRRTRPRTPAAGSWRGPGSGRGRRRGPTPRRPRPPRGSPRGSRRGTAR